jgi:hypothetical protein
VEAELGRIGHRLAPLEIVLVNTSAGAAYVAVREPVTLELVISGLLMAVGEWLHLTERHEHEHKHEPLTHTHSHVHDEHHQHEHDPLDPPEEPHSRSPWRKAPGVQSKP